MEAVSHMDLPDLSLASLPTLLTSLDPTRLSALWPLLTKYDFSHVFRLLQGLGIDLDYLKGVFVREGAAAQPGDQVKGVLCSRGEKW